MQLFTNALTTVITRFMRVVQQPRVGGAGKSFARWICLGGDTAKRDPGSRPGRTCYEYEDGISEIEYSTQSNNESSPALSRGPAYFVHFRPHRSNTP